MYKMVIVGSCERNDFYCLSFTDFLLSAKDFLLPFLNFTVDTVIEAYCPYPTSHPQIISGRTDATDNLFFLKAFFSDSL